MDTCQSTSAQIPSQRHPLSVMQRSQDDFPPWTVRTVCQRKKNVSWKRPIVHITYLGSTISDDIPLGADEKKGIGKVALKSLTVARLSRASLLSRSVPRLGHHHPHRCQTAMANRCQIRFTTKQLPRV